VSVGILAYNDKYILDKIEAFQESEGYDIPSLRLPCTLKNKIRCNEAKNWVDLHNPEWLSLKFVVYSFNSKGLPFGLSNQLKKIGSNRKWHIMFHETWLGMKTRDSLDYLIIGEIQKLIVRFIKKRLNFNVVHTHTQFYLRELKKLNFQPLYLPIFSNIPIFK